MEQDGVYRVDRDFAIGLLLEIAQERSLNKLLQKLVHRALERPETARIVIWLIDRGDRCANCVRRPDCPDQARCLHAVADGANPLAGPGRECERVADRFARIPLNVGLVGKIAATGQPAALSNLDKEPGDLAALGWLKSEQIRGFNGVPIIYAGEVLGVLGAFSRANHSDESRRWGRVFADHIAGAIANARAFEEIERLKAQLEQQNAYLREEIVEAKAFGDLVGQSGALGQIVSQIDLVAPTDASVLILGETGTGKELVAHEIHHRSRRRDGPLVRVNCASIPKELYESEFFGHAKGAFTGAIKDRAGRFETAEGGTLFLDEIAEVPLELQSKLLRVVQERQYERVGEDRTRRADVRIIAATNRDLRKEAAAGRFREDLYYRLNVFPIQVAPLREREEDIPLLADHFIQRSVKELRCPKPRLTRAGIVQLQGYDWPGNVRELQNVIERAVILARGGALEFDLPVRNTLPVAQSKGRPSDVRTPPEFLTESELRQRERENLLVVLEKAGWKIKGADGAAELLGVKATTLISRLKAMGLKPPK
jgi:transcriptional regulator with GAF, ATPase, and Fis domain